MSEEFEREIKYIVTKVEDVEKYLSGVERDRYINLLSIIEKGREREGKKAINGVFIRDNSKYYEEAWELVEKDVKEKQ